MLNSLYGKFGLSLECQSKIPYLENEIVKYKLSDIENRDGIYLPVATFITSYARSKTIRTSQKIRDYSLKKYNQDYYIYSDTDSIHCLFENVEELKDIIDIDDYKLGAWKHESTFTKSKFIRQKCYIEEIEDELHITCAGLPKQCYKYVNYENFETGFTCPDKLRFKHVKGGVILVNTDFTIKEDNIK